MQDILESRFTASSPRCPHPEWWHSRDMDSTEYEVSQLLAGLVLGLQPELVVETGACYGLTTSPLAGAVEVNGHGRMVSLEIDEERAAQAQRVVGGLATVIHGSSLDWEPDQDIDLLFLDSAWETRIPEFHHFSPWLKTGSIVAIHDTADRQLREQVRAEILNKYPVTAISLPTPRGLTLIECQ